jgi:hypothetical protein
MAGRSLRGIIAKCSEWASAQLIVRTGTDLCMVMLRTGNEIWDLYLPYSGPLHSSMLRASRCRARLFSRAGQAASPKLQLLHLGALKGVSAVALVTNLAQLAGDAVTDTVLSAVATGRFGLQQHNETAELHRASSWTFSPSPRGKTWRQASSWFPA